MKTYSVKQIADMLNTNPETVRRWIRDKKLRAVQVSRKDGNVITDDEFQRFLKATPKYASRFTAALTGSVAMIPMVGLPIAVATVLGAKTVSFLEGERQLNTQLQSDDVVAYLNSAIEEREKSISQKKNTISQLETEILKEQEEINQLRKLLKNGEFEK